MEEVIRILLSASHHCSEFHVAQPSNFNDLLFLLVQREAHVVPPTSASKIYEEVNNLVNICLQFLRNEVDSLHFEEYCRHHVGAGGFVLYTMDKVISSCVKHLHSIFADFTTNELVASFACHREQELSGDSYRDRCIHILQNVHQVLYRVENEKGELKMWMVGNAVELMPSTQDVGSNEEFNRIARDFLLIKQPVGGNDGRKNEGKRSRSDSLSLGSLEVDALEDDDSESVDEGAKRIKVSRRQRIVRRKNQDDDEWDSH